MQRLSSYQKKVSETSTSVDDVDAFLNKHPDKRCDDKLNGGIVRATTAAPFVDNLRGHNLTPAELRQRHLQSQRDYKAALKRARKVS